MAGGYTSTTSLTFLTVIDFHESLPLLRAPLLLFIPFPISFSCSFVGLPTLAKSSLTILRTPGMASSAAAVPQQDRVGILRHCLPAGIVPTTSTLHV